MRRLGFFFRQTLKGAIVAFIPTSAVMAAQSSLVAVSDIDYPPISYIDGGVPKGLGIDLIRALGGALHRDISIQLMDWDAAQQKVLTGQADLTGPLGVTEQRKIEFDLSDPLTVFEYSVCSIDEGLIIKDAADLYGKSVAVIAGGYPHHVLSSHHQINLIVVESYKQALDSLLRRKAQAFAVDKWVALYHLQELGLKKIQCVNPSFAVSDAVFAVKKGNSQLLAEINHAVAKMKSDGDIDKIEGTWSGQHIFVITQEKVVFYIVFAGGAAVFVLVVLLSLWVVSLRKEMAARERVSQSLLEKEVEQSRLEQLLAQANKLEALGQLAGGIAHDFNNVIGAINGYAVFIRDQAPADSAVANYAARILKTSDYGKDLVGQILAFARGNPATHSIFSVEDFLAEAVELLRASLPLSIDLVIDAVPLDGRFHADRAQLLQTIVNLGINARDALNGRAGRIRFALAKADSCSADGLALRTRPADRALHRTVERVQTEPGIDKVLTGIMIDDRPYVMLTVEDDGPGIPPHILPKIFEPLFTTKEGRKGTGFGLATTHTTVVAHRGAIVVTSRPGIGTRFDLYLPMVAE